MIRGFMLLVAGAVGVSGLALTVGALVAGTFFRHNSLDTSLIVLGTVLGVSVGAAWVFSRAFLKVLSTPHPRLTPLGRPRGRSGQHEKVGRRQPGTTGLRPGPR